MTMYFNLSPLKKFRATQTIPLSEWPAKPGEVLLLPGNDIGVQNLVTLGAFVELGEYRGEENDERLRSDS